MAASLLGAFPATAGERLEILFLGDDRGLQPIERYRELKQALGQQGFNLTFIENLNEITRERLDLYDALIVYASHEAEKLPEAIVPWVRDGGAVVALSNASANFQPSPEWFQLLGGRLDKHGEAEFSPQVVETDHPITKDLPEFEARDRALTHRDLSADRQVLQVREPVIPGETGPQPWTWIRTEGKGRVFYTASGHDFQVWNESAYRELLRRGILWSVGDERASEFNALELPKLVIEEPEIENRAHPDIPMLPLQLPLTPAQSAMHTQVPAGTRLELFASEPMVVNPIWVDWDERGRAWVVESFGYPNDVPDQPGTGADTIKILEDTDGDGKADKMTVFAEKLRHCTGLVFVRGGIIATDGPDLVFLRDDNQDGKSDTRRVLATGLKIWDTHASTSHLMYGFDNWIYATVGYSGVEMTVGGKEHKFGQGVFRFRPDLSTLELLQGTTNNTWGLGFTEEGDVMGSTANNNPSWILSIPRSAYENSGLEQPHTPRADTAPFFYPNTKDITQVDQIDRFTAAAGHSFYTDNVMAGIFQPNHAFITEPTGHLAALATIEPRDSLKSTDLRGNNIFASADAWAAPVVARPGPDGAVWIADWYNPIIQHNVVFRFWNPARDYDFPHSPYHVGEPKPGKGNAYQTPLRDRTHGRIWKIVPVNGELRKEVALDPKDPEGLLAGLRSPSQHIRLHAQRLLVERGGSEALKPLEQLITGNVRPEGSDKPLAAVHAIWTLEGLGAKPGTAANQILAAALESHAPLVSRHAMLALGSEDPSVVAALPSLLKEVDDARERLIVLTVAARTSPNDLVAAALWELVSTASLDEVQREAARLAMRRQGTTLLASAFAKLDGGLPDTWFGTELREIAGRVASSPNRPALTALLNAAPAELKAQMEAVIAASGTPAPASTPLPEHLTSGRDAYMKSCIECHQADGKGVEDTFPPLVGSEWVTGDPRTLLRIMLGGLYGPIEVAGTSYNSAMPGHSHSSDEEIAAIASFVRYAFGEKKEKPFPAEQVAALRPEVEKRKFAPWTVEELKKAAGR
jgi:putative membrane-bound dehydrogenase-like protein